MKQIWASTALGTAIALIAPAIASAATFTYSVPLSPDQEVQNPPVNSPASGTASGTLTGDESSWIFSYTVSFEDFEGPLLFAHIHDAPSGVNGPIVHELENAPIGEQSGTFSGDWSSNDAIASGLDPADTFSELLAGGYYFNLHSEVFPAGEIRGQIVDFDEEVAESVPEPATMLGLLAVGAFGVASQFNRRKISH